MNNLTYLDSSKVRNNFSSILNSVYNNKKTFVVRKSGIPVAKIMSLEKDDIVDDNFMDFAGMLTKKEGDKILKMIKKGRRDGTKLKNKLI